MAARALVARFALLCLLLFGAVLAVAVNTSAAFGPDEDTLCFDEGDCPPCPDPTAEYQADGTIVVNWTANETVVNYWMRYGDAAVDDNGTRVDFGANVTQFVHTNVTEGTTYWYRLHGDNAAGNTGYCPVPVMVTAIPFFPTALAGIGAIAAAVGGYVLLRRRS